MQMQGLGLNRSVNGTSVLPEIAAADNIDTSARVAGPDSSPGLGLAKPAAPPAPPSQTVDAPPVPSPGMPPPSAAPAPAAAAPDPASQDKTYYDFKNNPIRSIGRAMEAFGAGYQGQPSPVAAWQKRQIEDQAMAFKSAELGMNVIEAATKQLKGRPGSEHAAIIADFQKRFGPLVGQITPLLTAISNGQIQNAQEKIELGKQLGIFTPAILDHYKNDPDGLDKLLSTVMEHRATEETPAQAGAKAGAVTAAQEANKPRETQIVDLGDHKELQYKDTGETIKEFPVGTSASDANQESANYNLESNRLRSEFTNNSKPFVAIRDAYATMKDAAKQKTPASDLAIIFGYMKMLDPTSVVREGEQASAQNAPGVPNEVRQWWNQSINGQPLLDSRRKDIMDRAKSFYTVKENLQKQHESEYARLAKSSKIKPEDVVVDYKPKELQTFASPADVQAAVKAGKLQKGDHFTDANGVERAVP